jgi:hypothetical protein
MNDLGLHLPAVGRPPKVPKIRFARDGPTAMGAMSVECQFSVFRACLAGGPLSLRTSSSSVAVKGQQRSTVPPREAVLAKPAVQRVRTRRDGDRMPAHDLTAAPSVGLAGRPQRAHSGRSMDPKAVVEDGAAGLWKAASRPQGRTWRTSCALKNTPASDDTPGVFA